MLVYKRLFQFIQTSRKSFSYSKNERGTTLNPLFGYNLQFEMVDSIKLFHSVQKCFKLAGFIPQESNPCGYCTFNWRNLFHLFSLGLMLLTASTFFFFKARTVYEYGASYTGSNIIVATLLYYIVFMFKTKNILLLIERYERFIEKSKKSFWRKVFWSGPYIWNPIFG